MDRYPNITAFTCLALWLGLGALVATFSERTASAAHAPTSPPAPPSLRIEQIGPAGDVTSSRDVARIVFTDGTELPCAALFAPSTDPHLRARSISFALQGGLRVVFDGLDQ